MHDTKLRTVIDAMSQKAHSDHFRQRMADGITYIATRSEPRDPEDRSIFYKWLIPSFARTVFKGAYMKVPVDEFIDELQGVFENSVSVKDDCLLPTFPYQPPRWNPDQESASLEAFTQFFLDNYAQVHKFHG